MDVRPHPHIGLATVTYLFDGEIIHRDSLGSQQAIAPGDVNWMVAGRGIVHSERTGDERRRSGGARPRHPVVGRAARRRRRDRPPHFEHHPRATLPLVERPGARLRILAGHAYGARAPVGVRSPTLYVHAELDEGAELLLPEDHEERAAYVVGGELGCEGASYGPGSMLVFPARRECRQVHARGGASRVMWLGGGAPLRRVRATSSGNFVSSSERRAHRARKGKTGSERRVPEGPWRRRSSSSRSPSDSRAYGRP